MDTDSYIFPIVEIEYSILNYLDPLIDFPKLSLVNKYYYDFVVNDKLFMALKQFYLMEKINNKNLTEEENNFVSACTNNNLLVAKYLYQKYKINIHAYNECAFRWSCEKGHLEIAKWLHLLGNKKGFSNKDHWKKTLAKWLYPLGNEINPPINIHHEDAFICACKNGHLEIAKWLYILGNETGSPINIHADKEDAFKYACHNGHLEIAKWLYLLGNERGSPIDIHADNELAFRLSCYNGYLEVAKWLCTLCSQYNIKIDSTNKIEYQIE